MRSILCTVALAATLNTPFAAAQQSLVQSQGQILYFSGPIQSPIDGDVAPGSPFFLERFGGSYQFDAVVDGSGNAFFLARLVSNAGGVLTPTYLQSAYYYGSNRDNLTLLMRGGDPEPSGTIPNAVLSTATSGPPLSATPRIGESGLMMFGATIWDFVGNSITAANDTVLYTGTPLGFQILAREGDLAPGCGGATYVSSFASPAFQPTGLNSNGIALFRSALFGAGAAPPVDSTNNEAWFTGVPNNVLLMLRKGDSYPWIAGGATISGLGSISQINALGEVVTEVTLAYGTGSPAVTYANDRVLLLYQPGAGLTEILREGDAGPFPGTTFSPSSSWNFNTGASTFNVAGELLVYAYLSGAVAPGVDDRVLIRTSAGGYTVVLRRGDAAPGVAGANWDIIQDATLCLNDAGQVSFQATLVNGGVTAANDSGVWTGAPGNWSLVAREGSVAPGTGENFGQAGFASRCPLNGKGQVLFSNALQTSGANSAWLWDKTLGLNRIFYPGDSIEVTPGVFRFPSSAGFINNSNGEGRALSFNNDGTAVVKLGMTDGSQLMVGMRLGSLTGLPNRVSQSIGGTYSLFLNAGAGNATNTYVVAGGVSGTFPGLPIGPFVLPLNFDFYTQFTLDNANVGIFVDTFGLLDADGRRKAQILVPPLPGLAGLVFNHAYAVLDGSQQLVFVSEPASLLLTP